MTERTMHLDETKRWDPYKRVSLIIDTGSNHLVEENALFGEAVKEGFPAVAADISAAGNCLAAECNTAAVFHLMRVADAGLRALARDRRIKLPRKERLGLEAWDGIIRELESAESTIRQYPKSPAQEAQYAFHHEAMARFARFRDVFRNQLMHVQEHFGQPHAVAIFEDVQAFMRTLATRITENSRTPLVWKGKKWAQIRN